MICPTCNTANRDDAKFCKVCGRSLATAAVAASSGYTSPAASVPALDTEPASSPVDEAPIEVHEDDISQEPTLIISPDKMMAYHQRLWHESVPAPEDESDAGVEASAPETESQAAPEPAA